MLSKDESHLSYAVPCTSRNPALESAMIQNGALLEGGLKLGKMLGGGHSFPTMGLRLFGVKEFVQSLGLKVLRVLGMSEASTGKGLGLRVLVFHGLGLFNVGVGDASG